MKINFIILLIILIILVVYIIINIICYYTDIYLPPNIKNIENEYIVPIDTSIIPKVIYLSYKHKDIPEYIIPNWSKLNPEYTIKLYDNNDCVDFLREEYGMEYVDIFNYIKDGPIKADFWRVCILYKYGGVYSDIDIEPLVPIKDFLEPGVTFLTCTTAFNFLLINKVINPHIIIATSGHYILKMCIDTYLYYYRTQKEYNYWDWSIVYIMYYSLYYSINKVSIGEGIYYDEYNNKFQFIKEVAFMLDEKNYHCDYKNVRILNNRYDGYDSSNHFFK
jgi:hypothetical protein